MYFGSVSSITRRVYNCCGDLKLLLNVCMVIGPCVLSVFVYAVRGSEYPAQTSRGDLDLYTRVMSTECLGEGAAGVGRFAGACILLRKALAATASPEFPAYQAQLMTFASCHRSFEISFYFAIVHDYSGAHPRILFRYLEAKDVVLHSAKHCTIQYLQ
jgi:hypothetical protein